ncbi:MAG: beta-lactamase family protein, partial [Parachlamydia sp.]|nr:beta-lactamase family protein [Parachlamydia sp.]
MKFSRILILFVCLFSLTADLQAFERADLKDIDTVVHDALSQCQVPGMALGILVDDQIILARGYGYRDLDQKLPVTEETLFPIASCTKAFTTFLFGQLVDEGKISWDDPVIRYLPEFRLYDQRTDQVTIRDLLAHRTGIPRHDAIWVCQDLVKSDILRLLPYLEPKADLGRQFEYSNLMYAVAGMLFEKVANQTWEAAIAERIFRPLKMESAGISQAALSSNFAQPYVSFDGVIEAVPFCDVEAVKPGSAIYASVAEMLKWVREQLSEGHLVSRDVLQEMHSAQISFPPKYEHREVFKEGYGLGWFVGRYRGHLMINHEGHRAGFFSDAVLLPDLKMGIVLLTNSGSDGRFVISAIRNMLLD